LILKLRAAFNAVGGDANRDACELETDDRCDEYLFADMLAASTALDFGAVPADFFEMRCRHFAASRASIKEERT
jgi:hypothetical protein